MPSKSRIHTKNLPKIKEENCVVSSLRWDQGSWAPHTDVETLKTLGYGPKLRATVEVVIDMEDGRRFVAHADIYFEKDDA